MAEITTKQDIQQVSSPASGSVSGEPGNPVYGGSSATTSRSSVTRQVSGNETARRIVMFIFGVVQVVIILRFALLLMGANDTGIVSAIHSFSQLFVAPFVGIFGAPVAGHNVLEWASLAALVGWTILEFVVLAVLQIVTRRPEGPMA